MVTDERGVMVTDERPAERRPQRDPGISWDPGIGLKFRPRDF